VGDEALLDLSDETPHPRSFEVLPRVALVGDGLDGAEVMLETTEDPRGQPLILLLPAYLHGHDCGQVGGVDWGRFQLRRLS
jgi:hypothetical protein